MFLPGFIQLISKDFDCERIDTQKGSPRTHTIYRIEDEAPMNLL
jgi:hypothetical protein